jgi:hypothetical protein
LGLVHILEPLFKILYFKATTRFPINTIIENVTQINGARELFEFWFLFPIAGIALLGVKRWSYPIFVSVQIYSIFTHLTYESYTWPYVSSTPQWPSLAILACNVGMIIYFLLPEIRRPFFDKDMRWWEHRERYTLRIPCSYSSSANNTLRDAEILNISHSGAFISTDIETANIGDKFTVNISFMDLHITLNAKVVSMHEFDNETGLGIMFSYDTIWEQLHMNKIMKQIARANKKHFKQALAA